jgi:hypothetical protein
MQWPSINAAADLLPSQFLSLLGRIVVQLAERIEWARPELLDVASVRFPVVTDCRCRDPADLAAHPA